MTSALDSGLKLSLVLSAGAGNTAGKDLATLADELAEARCILVIDVADVFFAEDALVPEFESEPVASLT